MPLPVAQLADGATGPALTITFSRLGKVLDLAGYTVSAVVQRPGMADLQKQLVLLNPTTDGQAQLQWAVGDLVNSSARTAEYTIDFILAAPDGTEEKPPLPIKVSVRPSVG